LGLVLAAAIVLASLPPAGAGPASKGVAAAPPKTTTTTTMPPPLPVLELQALAPTVPEPAPTPAPVEVVPAPVAPAPIPQESVIVGADLPAWAWDGPADLSITGMAAVMMAIGCPPSVAPIMAAIGQAESRGRTDALGDVHLQGNGWTESVSAWQVRTRVEQLGTGGNRDRNQIHDLWWHARAAYEISEGCTNADPWSTWRFGQALQHFPDAVAAVLWLRGGR
jgi:hypothetical protein